jgi:DNA-binding GntR family transcriptional regulator
VALKASAGPRTAEDIAVTELRAAILRGDLLPGAAIRQDATAREFGLSVIPLREALKTLTAEGLVSHRPQQGYVVTELEPAELDGIYRVRELLEGEAERVGVGRVNHPKLTAMRASMRAQQAAARAGDAVGVIANNRCFHFALFDLCDNPLLRRYVRQTWDALDPHHAVLYRRTLVVGDTSRPDRMHGEHRTIVDALAAGDLGTAIDLLAEHRRTGHDWFKALLCHAESPWRSQPPSA